MADTFLYHPSRGVWVAVTKPSPAIYAKYPKGTVEIAPPPGDGYEYDGSAWVVDPTFAGRLLAETRDNNVIPLSELLGNMAEAGWITENAAERWLDRSTLPPQLIAEIQGRTNIKDRIAARGAFFSERARRMDPAWVGALVRFGKTDTEIDAVFGIDL